MLFMMRIYFLHCMLKLHKKNLQRHHENENFKSKNGNSLTLSYYILPQNNDINNNAKYITQISTGVILLGFFSDKNDLPHPNKTSACFSPILFKHVFCGMISDLLVESMEDLFFSDTVYLLMTHICPRFHF